MTIGVASTGADLSIASDVPIGAGLSSSAALEVACGYALAGLAGVTPDLDRLARVAQRAEHEFAGMRCGIMDQMIACHGRAGAALLLDTRSLARPVAAAAAGGARGGLQHDGRATRWRRVSTTRGAPTARPAWPCSRATRRRSVRCATSRWRSWTRARADLPPRIYRRCRHVVTENARVEEAAGALASGDIRRFGALMDASHASLRDDYEVSCPELDRMVDIVRGLDGVYGARMTGGGFGGCAVALIDASAAISVAARCRARLSSGDGTRARHLGDDGRQRRRRVVARLGARGMTDQHPHRRFNPLRDDWVLVSPQRTARPWQGQVEAPRAGGRARARSGLLPVPRQQPRARRHESGLRVDVCLRQRLPGTLPELRRTLESRPNHCNSEPESLFIAQPERGICRVMCFSPRHDLTLARMDAARCPPRRRRLGRGVRRGRRRDPWVRYALVFENRGAMMGASNPHPHGQIWATEDVPNEPAREQRSRLPRHRAQHGSCLLCDYAARRGARWRARRLRERRVHARSCRSGPSGRSKRSCSAGVTSAASTALDAAERDALADMLKRLTTRYDNLFETPFPYSMGFHQQPTQRRGRRRAGTSTRTSIRRCCARRRCASSWSASSCSARRSAT